MFLIRNLKPTRRPLLAWPNRAGVFAVAKILPWSVHAAFCIAAAAMFCGRVAQAQISPGAMSRAHAQLEGVTKCASCHDFRARSFQCLECHLEIKRRVEAGAGYHARAYKSTAGETDCARCHMEHRGPKLSLVLLDRKSFDHRAQTGFALEGKHRAQSCESCHTAAKIAPAARSEIKVKDLNRSFLGLRRECTNCHQEPHQNQLGADCLGCHNQEAWKPASGFNHSRAQFQLTGLHQQVACEKCHARPEAARTSEAKADVVRAASPSPQKVLVFKGVPFNGCPSCHSDPHHGGFQDVKLNGKCDGCHNTGGWKNNRPSRDFNHNLTKFRLTGKHADLACGKCHKESDFRRPVAHELCQNCHEDPHKGQFASRAAGSDCSACHSPANFKPPLFDREAHRSSAFPLAGKHASLPCAKCHQPEGREARYKTGKLTCPACHAEPHGGEFAYGPYNNNCDQCHTDKGFEATTFSLERHAQTRFPLTGRHAEVECGKCHKALESAVSKASPEIVKISFATPVAADGNGALRDAQRQYHFTSYNCNACHTDPHGISPQANLTCETCHVTEQWKALRPFDHSRTRFKLDGSHLDDAQQPLACVKCHKASGQAENVAARGAPAFSRTTAQCSGCHSEKDAHGGQFNRPAALEKDCSSCHAPGEWKGTVFNHDNARFSLSVVHAKVECAKCHKEQKEVDGKMVRVYRETPTDCLKCH